MQDIYDEFVEKASARAQKRVVGDPFDEGVEQGPQVDQDELNKILAYIDIGKREGARMLCGGKRHGDAGYYVSVCRGIGWWGCLGSGLMHMRALCGAAGLSVSFEHPAACARSSFTIKEYK